LPCWYVVYTQPHRERRAETHLRYQGLRTFLPLCRKTIRHARRFQTVNAPFFPRYLFVELSLQRDRWRSIAGTFGVSHLIMEGGRPKPIRSSIVGDLKASADPAGVISLRSSLHAGASVRLVSGPLAGLIGELVELDEDGRVKVLLDFIGTRASVKADRVDVVPIA